MDITTLKKYIEPTPSELYRLWPGQIAYYVRGEGLGQREVSTIADLFSYFKKLNNGIDIKLSIIPTENEVLIDTITGRSLEEVRNPFKVIIGTRETIAGFASYFFGESIEKIVEKVPDMGASSSLSVSATDLPLVLTLDVDDPYVRKYKNVFNVYHEPDDSTGPLEVLLAKPEPGSKEEKALAKKEEVKFYSLLRECYVLGVDLDIDKIKKAFDASINSNIDYQLIIRCSFHRDGIRRVCDTCDIYVADDKKHILNLTAIEKAVYLSFLLYPQGIRIKESFWGFRETCIKIYGKLPYDERCEKSLEGIRNDENAIPEVFESTLRGYLSTIRSEVAKKVLNPKTALEFAIEGYKDQEFGIARSTPEIRAQIKEQFGV